jgi:ESS family glutamate:Na+ symporter
MLDLVDNWNSMNYFVLLGILLFIAKIIKEKVPFLNKVIIPTALIAGFIGLILSNGFLNLINIDREGILHNIVYHALAIGFIALSLKRDKNPTNKKVWSTGMIIVMTYLLQAVIGVTVVVVFFSDLFLGAGLLLPLGFGQGPGLATSIGLGYAEGVGNLIEGGALGATIASLGFVVGGTVGVAALNYLARKHNLKVDRVHRENSTIKEKFEFESIKELRVFDALTAQITIIFVIYGMVYVTLVVLENYFLPMFGSIGETFIGVAHGFNFLIGILYALLFKKILVAFENKGKNINFLTNNYILSNISSLAFNFLIAAAVMTITIESIKEYYLFVIVLVIFASIFTYAFVSFIVKKVYDKKYTIHYFLGLFGMLTGTASTGLALLKGVDQDFESPVAEEMVVGSGTAISMALPLFALLMFPGLAITQNNDIFNWLVFIVPITYFFILLGITLLINKEK